MCVLKCWLLLSIPLISIELKVHSTLNFISFHNFPYSLFFLNYFKFSLISNRTKRQGDERVCLIFEKCRIIVEDNAYFLLYQYMFGIIGVKRKVRVLQEGKGWMVINFWKSCLKHEKRRECDFLSYCLKFSSRVKQNRTIIYITLSLLLFVLILDK